MAKIELQNVCYTYGPGTPYAKIALKDVSLSVEAGKITGIIGHTGSGKSTLVRMLNGLLAPDSGRVLLDGVDINADKKALSSVRCRVGLVMQYPEYQLFDETVEKDIAFGPRNMGLSSEDIAARVREAAGFTGLSEELLSKSPFDLSGGQKRRVAIAGVLAMMPSVLILDEPTAGLDPKGRDEILDLISMLHKTRGITVILVSHSMEDVARLVDRILVFHRGKLVFDDVPREVFRHGEELVSMGLAVPAMTDIMHYLSQNGIPVAGDALTVEEAADLIMNAVAH